MVLNENADLYEGLSKELWGILHFEMPLHYLYKFLKIKSSNITLDSFMDFIVFPFKIPVFIANEIYEALQARFNNPEYLALVEEANKETDNVSFFHNLVMELLYIRTTGDEMDISRLKEIFDLPIEAFYSISLQLVELGYCSTPSIMSVYMKYQYIAREREGDI